MTDRLAGKTVLITGGTTGIGLASAQRFAAEGATVVATGRNPETLEAARQQLGSSVEVVASDAADTAAIDQLFADIKAKHGGLDVLFLNAGIFKVGGLGEASIDDFDQMWNVNVRGPWHALNTAPDLLNDGASVIVNTSTANEIGLPGVSAYAATKGAMRSMIRVAATELSPRGIRVNAVSPGPIETPIFGKAELPPEAMEQVGELILSRVPLNRFGNADEVANTALFLASDESSFIQGSEIQVDGGMAQV